MFKKLLFFLLLFLVPLLVIDTYVYYILSPVEWIEEGSKSTKSNPQKRRSTEEKEDIDTPQKSSESLGCLLKSSTILFKDYDEKAYIIDFNICDSILQQSIENRKNIKANNPCKDLVDYDDLPIDVVVEAYKKQIKILALDYKSAAEYVVASVQNIPYTLVHNHSHKAAENPATYIKNGVAESEAKVFANLIKEMHAKRKHIKPLEQIGGCLGEIAPNGIVSPLEFFFNKMGDCDSRATALYLVLKKLGYDVLELVNNVESHAILAINIPEADGNIYYTHGGKKYYVWETTFFDTKQSRVGVYADGLRFMKTDHLWKPVLF